eukprot:10922703-Alexandrium_andersonii.AAC.1
MPPGAGASAYADLPGWVLNPACTLRTASTTSSMRLFCTRAMTRSPAISVLTDAWSPVISTWTDVR